MKPSQYLGAVWRFKIQSKLLSLAARPTVSVPLTLHGRNWMVPDGLLRPGDLCYSGGVGEEIDLELWMAKDKGVRIALFDPTPRSIKFMEKLKANGLPSLIEFHACGLWKRDETLRFYAPHDPTWVSHTVDCNDPNRPYFDAPCRSIGAFMKQFGHERVDIVKLNIEGAEQAVLESMLEDKIVPRVLMLTFEGKSAFNRTLGWIKRLREVGLELAGRHVWAFTFVRRDALGNHG